MTDQVCIEKDAGWRDESSCTSVPNRIIRDDRLSWEARALLVWLASHPDPSAVRMRDLERAGGAGRDRTRRILRELESAGYLTRAEAEFS